MTDGPEELLAATHTMATTLVHRMGSGTFQARSGGSHAAFDRVCRDSGGRGRVARRGRRLVLALVVGALASQSPAGFCDSGPQPSRARPAASGPGSAQGLFEQILRRYGEYRDFQARFVETPISRASGEGAPESGLVSFKRPELWRWEYSFPEKKVVVVRGSTVFIAIEGEPEVSQYDLAEAGQEAGIGALLSGGEQVGRSFSARFDPSGSEKEPVLRLEPLQLSEQYDHVLVRVRRRDLTIREVVVVDPGGNRLRFQFDAFRTNLGLPQKLFDPPPAHPSR